jgi:RNA polymerase sigma-70 factor, ECF subfamily
MRPDADASVFSSCDMEPLMMRYPQADSEAVMILIERLSPQLYRFFASEMGSRTEAEDMLQDAWLQIHRVRHTCRPGAPLLPWVYGIARCVQVDNYRRRRRIKSHEIGVDELPEASVEGHENSNPPIRRIDGRVAGKPA